MQVSLIALVPLSVAISECHSYHLVPLVTTMIGCQLHSIVIDSKSESLCDQSGAVIKMIASTNR